jgi:hypothetical protein
MLYFFILPAFVLYVLAMTAFVAHTSIHSPAAPLRPYVVSILLWSSVGFVHSTIAYSLMLVGIFGLLDRFDTGKPSTAGGLVMAAFVFCRAVLPPQRRVCSAVPRSACGGSFERHVGSADR